MEGRCPITWQWFITLTFPWKVRPETAVYKLRRFINELEKTYRANVCVVAGQESKPRQHGMNVPTHFHLLLASHARISHEAIEGLWVGQVTRRPTNGRDGQSVFAEKYQPHERGAEYCLKTINDADGDWFIHRLDHFLPGARGPSKPNHKSVRSDKRNMQQLARLATTSALTSRPKMP
jgi:hypothetical protein